jgi:hypothetical protein
MTDSHIENPMREFTGDIRITVGPAKNLFTPPMTDEEWSALESAAGATCLRVEAPPLAPDLHSGDFEALRFERVYFSPAPPNPLRNVAEAFRKLAHLRRK